MATESLRYNRKIIIGDVHGCYDELITLLKNIEYDSNKDELYFVGDLGIKGPKSNEVISFIRNNMLNRKYQNKISFMIII